MQIKQDRFFVLKNWITKNSYSVTIKNSKSIEVDVVWDQGTKYKNRYDMKRKLVRYK